MAKKNMTGVHYSEAEDRVLMVYETQVATKKLNRSKASVANRREKLLKHYRIGEELTDEELETLELISKGNTDDMMQDLLETPIRTIGCRRKRVILKLGARNTPHSIRIAIEKEILTIMVKKKIHKSSFSKSDDKVILKYGPSVSSKMLKRKISSVSYRKRFLLKDQRVGNDLSVDELESLDLLSQGNTNKQVEEITGVSHRTIGCRRDRFLIKLGANNIAHAVRLGFEKGLLE